MSEVEDAEDAVHDPVDGGGVEVVDVAGADASEVVDDLLDEWLLDVWRVGDVVFFVPLFVVECDGVVVEDGEGERALVSDDLYAVGAC